MPRLRISSFPVPTMLATLLMLLIQADPALALHMEFYTYGGFGPVTQAFRKIALIFTDSAYLGLFFTVVVLGIVAAASAWTVKMATGVKIVPLVWAAPVLIGVVIYLGLFVPKGSLTVYDPVLNRFETIGNIPNSIVFTAGTLNTIERGLVEIIDTAGIPGAKYQENAGGIGFNALKAAGWTDLKNDYAKASMARYIRDCVMFELTRPGTTLSLDTLRNNTTDFIPELEKAINPWIYTVYYDAANPEGVSMTCTDAWNNIKPIYTDPNFYSDAIKALCGQTLFDPSQASDLNTCKNLVTNTLNATVGLSVTPEKFIQQRKLSELLYQFLFQSDYQLSTLLDANRRITTSGMGMGITMNAWIPIMRAVMTSVAIGLIPFLTLFIPTPLAGKALSVMAGFFVFLTTWGITDAVLHGAAMDFAVDAFEDIRQADLGVYASFAFPETSTKILAMFGVIRSSGIMLASFLSMMLIRFGGHALAMLAGNLSGVAQRAGAQAGHTALTGEGMTDALQKQVNTAALADAIPEHRFDNQAAAKAWAIHKQIGRAEAEMAAVDGAAKAGKLPAGMSMKDQARAVAAGKGTPMGTERGPVTVSTGPDGKTTMIAGETPVSWNFVRSETLGADGSGKATEKGAAGSIEYAVDQNGNYTATSASVNGVNPINFATSLQKQRVQAAAHNLASNENYSNLLNQLSQDSLTSTEARSFQDQLKNVEQEKWSRAVEDGSAFSMIKNQSVRQALEGHLKAGGGWNFLVKFDAGGKASITAQGESGEKVSFNVSEKEAQMFEQQQMRLRTEALSETLQDSKNLSYASNLAKNIGASDAQSYLEQAKTVETDSATYGANLMTAWVRNYAINRFGDDSPENMRRAVDHFNFLATRGGESGVEQLRKDIKGFASGYDAWGDTSGLVNETISSTKQQLEAEKVALQDQVNPVADIAADKAAAINDNTFTDPTKGNLQEPSRDKTIKAADEVRTFNEKEKNGEGRIQTSIPNMTKEGLSSAIQNITSEYMTSIKRDVPKPFSPKDVVKTTTVPLDFDEALRQENLQTQSHQQKQDITSIPDNARNIASISDGKVEYTQSPAGATPLATATTSSSGPVTPEEDQSQVKATIAASASNADTMPNSQPVQAPEQPTEGPQGALPNEQPYIAPQGTKQSGQAIAEQSQNTEQPKQEQSLPRFPEWVTQYMENRAPEATGQPTAHGATGDTGTGAGQEQVMPHITPQATKQPVASQGAGRSGQASEQATEAVPEQPTAEQAYLASINAEQGTAASEQVTNQGASLEPQPGDQSFVASRGTEQAAEPVGSGQPASSDTKGTGAGQEQTTSASSMTDGAQQNTPTTGTSAQGQPSESRSAGQPQPHVATQGTEKPEQAQTASTPPEGTPAMTNMMTGANGSAADLGTAGNNMEAGPTRQPVTSQSSTPGTATEYQGINVE
ncbi:hypothetical protein GF1_16520 [Desulfolithobacter dissulfuricans]|uniref:TraG N-terminal Proteobacteria domain-containing protein n=1 Tax=Desulfolithobacter dissulfuricans TaxID=2795293 RepID=A0A915U9U1_9BACT|nr:conjugal transfer protein TraG N-terminal domain-containing protein [Desulfolithobacter dissulfuricans]BCO09276.1 hypothetical protein GF1_16520 [Desulfolithobacter dissulfuricans]